MKHPWITNVKEVGAAWDSSFVLLQNGSVLVFGRNQNPGSLGLNSTIPVDPFIQSPTVNPHLKDIVSIHVSSRVGQLTTFMASDNVGRLFVFGLNANGCLGIGRTGSVVLPTLVPEFQNVTKAFSNSMMSIIQTTAPDGTTQLFSAGKNDYGALCIGVLDESYTTNFFTPIPNSQDFSDFVIGSTHSVFLTRSQQVFVCGRNTEAQLAIDPYDKINRYSPTLFPTLSGITQISVQHLTMVFLSKNGDRSWATQLFGTDTRLPVPVSSLRGTVKKVFVGRSAAWIQMMDGKILSFGDNSAGLCGVGSVATQIEHPTLLKSSMTFSSVAPGQFHTIYLGNDSQVYGSGSNEYGEFGYDNGPAAAIPVRIPFFANVSMISAGSFYSLFVQGNRTYILGRDQWTVEDPMEPLLMLESKQVLQLVAHATHGFILTVDGLYGFGSSSSGQLTLEHQPAVKFVFPRRISTISNFTQVMTGMLAAYSIVVDAWNNSWSFGSNSVGRLGINSTNTGNFPSPVRIPGGFAPKTLAGCDSQSFFIDSDSSVYSFGWGDKSRLGHGDYLNVNFPKRIEALLSVIDVGSGSDFAVAISQCNASWSGPKCEYPVCFGISSIAADVCTGQGVCIAPDLCACTLPNFGDACENSEYFWRAPISGPWTSSSQWFAKSGNEFSPSLQYPSKPIEKITIDVGGSFSIFLTTDLVLGEIVVEKGTKVAFSSSSGSFQLKSLIIRDATSVVTFLGGKINIETVSGTGSLIMDGKCVYDVISSTVPRVTCLGASTGKIQSLQTVSLSIVDSNVTMVSASVGSAVVLRSVVEVNGAVKQLTLDSSILSGSLRINPILQVGLMSLDTLSHNYRFIGDNTLNRS